MIVHKLLHWGVCFLTHEPINLLLNVIIELPLAPNSSLLSKEPNLSGKSGTEVIKLRFFALRVVGNENSLMIERRLFHFSKKLVLERAYIVLRDW